MYVGGPEQGNIRVTIAESAHGAVKRLGGSGSVNASLICLEVGVEFAGDINSDAVVYIPQCADYVRESGELKSGGQVDRFVEERCGFSAGRGGTRQVGELSVP